METPGEVEPLLAVVPDVKRFPPRFERNRMTPPAVAAINTVPITTKGRERFKTIQVSACERLNSLPDKITTNIKK
jgi:hypothetical protein